MTQVNDKSKLESVQGLGINEAGFLKGIVEQMLQKYLEAEMTAHIGASPYERTESRRGSRNGYKPRVLKTRVGSLDLMIPQDREGTFQTELFDRYQRNEKALVLSMMEMYVHGVSTRKVGKITETLCGTMFSKSTVSRLSKELDSELDEWLKRPLKGKYPVVIADAQFHKVRESRRVVSKAVLTVKGISSDGHREILSVGTGDTENESFWSDQFKSLKERGLSGVEFLVSDDHSGLRKALSRHFSGVTWQRCQTHFSRNVLTRLPKSKQSGIAEELRSIYNSSSLEKAKERSHELVDSLEESHPVAANILDEGIEEALAVFDRPKAQRKRLRTSNSLERYHEEIRRRTRVVRIFPNERSLLRLVGTMAMEFSEEWLCGKRYLDMSPEESLVVEKEKEKEEVKKLAA